jgi:hypothetical protein
LVSENYGFLVKDIGLNGYGGYEEYCWITDR